MALYLIKLKLTLIYQSERFLGGKQLHFCRVDALYGDDDSADSVERYLIGLLHFLQDVRNEPASFAAIKVAEARKGGDSIVTNPLTGSCQKNSENLVSYLSFLGCP